MKKYFSRDFLFYLILAVVFLTSGFLLLLNSNFVVIENLGSWQFLKKIVHSDNNHIKPPEYFRGIYLTAYSAGRDDFRQDLIEKMKTGRINSVVIDIKEVSGNILYASEVEAVKKINAVDVRMDVEKVIDDFHLAGIFVIARQVVFQDSKLAFERADLALKTKQGNVWKNYNGLAWTDPQNLEVWEYNLAIAREAVSLGFDEINFDYIRYPSDGNLKNLDYDLPEEKIRSDVLRSFSKYLSENLSNKTKISFDMFGLVLDHAIDGSGMGIGQRLVDAVDYADYICPMVYPSHYPSGYLGFLNPALYPGEVINNGLKISHQIFVDKRAKNRPWLQAFNLGAVYDKKMIDAQTAVVDNDSNSVGWIFWNARNVYADYIFK